MEQQDIFELLVKVQEHTLSPEEALNKLKLSPFEDLGYAKVDHHRSLRQGTCEVIYGAGKTPEQILGIATSMDKHGETNIIITRLSEQTADFLSDKLQLFYDSTSKIGIVNRKINYTASGSIVIATGGTSDIPVAEEAALTAEALGNHVLRLYDVGVSGVQRLFHNMEFITNANVIIAVAGMEGALASIIGGLSDCPVIAVPTSVGYGANFGGLSALLAMLNSCASGVSVVNIDNGFGAGYLASMINHMGGKKS
ncbi:nickel pincer cofactor biosynthesis protein LarB [Velocimicrobium porci]|uniref:Nickel pincer cofactor biosynthesis protein LarB n=1 Tax=Velocimicrobium porci TaxID=2606634 RepID=A0A6L5Y039_9FIRM|nr:nickel pincer cofactor biosynthesis protein LarB [Velocimicrobium porci]MSS64197.1 nickel pincer cofactor biosynthesis protein LarB [Velocimicrobium porci]